MATIDKDTFVNLINNTRADMPDIITALYKVNNLSIDTSPDKLYNEFMLNGGNSIVNFFRGTGVVYSEVLSDVSKYLKLDSQDKEENQIRKDLHKKFEQVLDDTTQRNHIVFADNEKNSRSGAIKLTTLLIIEGVLLGEIFIGLGLESSVLAGLAGLGIATESLGFLVPGLNILIGAYTIKKIADPAYRKTVPSVLYTELLFYIENMEKK